MIEYTTLLGPTQSAMLEWADVTTVWIEAAWYGMT